MIQELAFADAARPMLASVLKTRLKPYSIGHELLLQNQRNPLVIFGEKEFSELQPIEQRKAVIRAVLVCCQTWEENKHPHKWLRLWSWRVKRENFSVAIADFRNYRFLGSTFPMFSTAAKSENGRSFGAPFICRLLNFVNCNFDAPLGFTQWRYFAVAEDEGRCQIENENEREMREKSEEMINQILKEKEATCPV